MKYYTDKTKEQLLSEVKYSISNSLSNLSNNLRNASAGNVIDTLRWELEETLNDAFETLINNLYPESDVDDIILGK